MYSRRHKRIFFAVILISTCAFFTSCNKKPAIDPQIPAALQEVSPSKLDISYKRGGYEDLVDELFEELLAQNTQLKEIVDAQVAMMDKISQQYSALYEADGKSNRYYTSARNHATAVQDSTMGRQLMARIEVSEARWQAQMVARDALGERLLHSKKQLQDELESLKIRLTLPQIQDYQRKMTPQLGPGNAILAEQAVLLKKMQQLPPP
jgi:hypothetical protein